jgi:hypothetical protein
MYPHTPRFFRESVQTFCFVRVKLSRHRQRAKECAGCLFSVSYDPRRFAIYSPVRKRHAMGIWPNQTAWERSFLRQHYNMRFPQALTFRVADPGAILL